MPQPETKKIRLFVLETEEFYRYTYQFIPLGDNIELAGIAGETHFPELKRSIIANFPDVLLIGTGKLEDHVIDLLNQLRTEFPRLGIILLLANYSPQNIDALRRTANVSEAGFAIFLRQSLGKIDQLSGIVAATSYGQFILDPPLASYLFSEKPENTFLNQLTNRELEILSFLSKGYSNMAIAETLFIDVKTVEHHLNSIYSKLKAESDCNQRHLRVAATRLYLQETGILVA